MLRVIQYKNVTALQILNLALCLIMIRYEPFILVICIW